MLIIKTAISFQKQLINEIFYCVFSKSTFTSACGEVSFTEILRTSCKPFGQEITIDKS